MEDLLFSLKTNYNNIAGIQFFNSFKTGNALMDTVLSSFIISLAGWLFSYISMNVTNDEVLQKLTSFNNIRYQLCKKNSIVLDGRKANTVSRFNDNYSISTAYSDGFKAIWEHIMKNIKTNKDIYQIKEIYANYSVSSKNKYTSTEHFVVFQNKHFQIDKDIYVHTFISNEEQQPESQLHQKSSKIEKIRVILYSYKLSLAQLIQYIETIKYEYLTNVKTARLNKRFIYTLMTAKPTNEYDDDYSCWKETLYESYKTFDNIFFDGKRDIIRKVDFFLNNKDWYIAKGIPYTLGIGLRGPPGTGKTSFIKALGNYTNRHLIVLSFKLIKTKPQLDQFFFENRYNTNNEADSMTFDKKIIVFEDIDCVMDIILERNSKKHNTIALPDTMKMMQGTNTTSVIDIPPNEDTLTLDDILNLWDGIRETPGRILVISSNHYSKLDPALTRPGRIDITHEFSNASHETISEIYTHLFEKDIERSKLAKIKEYAFSPAEVINTYVSNKVEEDFIRELTHHKRAKKGIKK